jgi:hopene-associated glycosyltransferase HpnB
VIGDVAGAAVLATWLYLLLAHGRFWRTSIRLPGGSEPMVWPSVVAVVPARNEAELLPHTLPSLLGQHYDGEFRVVVVDDDSTDSTGDVAADLGADVVRGTGPPPGWAGKVAAQAAGVAAAGNADYLLFTDADIAYPPTALRDLVRSAASNRLVLTSQMVRLRAATQWERLIVPAFVYFFAQLYPFARVNAAGRTAAAAGGCMLVDRTALEAAGGLEAIRGALIDDVALGCVLKKHGRIWLGLSSEIRSIRPYPKFAALWQMIARSAYTQLRYSPLWLAGAVLGVLFVYVLPLALLVFGLAAGAPVSASLGGAAWLVMTASYLPMLQYYQLNPLRALSLPIVAALYGAMTVDSARRHRLGRGAEWKGRVATH